MCLKKSKKVSGGLNRWKASYYEKGLDAVSNSEQECLLNVLDDGLEVSEEV
jgi:hypothetical protein